MKRFIFSLTAAFLIFFALPAFAQSSAQKFSVNGITVIMKPTVKDIINVSVYYKGGVTNYPADKAGIEDLALAGATECGTKLYSKDEFKNIADKYGINILGNSTYDYGVISLNCIAKYFNEGWNLLAEAIKDPIYGEKEFELLKQRRISGLKNADANPDSKINKMAIANTFKGTPYAIDPDGEINTVSSFSADQVKDYYYNTLLNKNRMFVVVVGKISKNEIISKIKKAFSALTDKPYTPFSYHTPEISSNTLNVEPRKLATNYIIGVVNAPLFTSKDFVANRLAVSAFSTNLFTEIRTKRNLSYAPYAVPMRQQMPFNYMYVSTTNPKASVEVMVNEINRLITKGFSQKEFNDIKNLYITSNYMKEESTDMMASSLGRSEILGDWKMDEEFIPRIQKTTPLDMTNVFKKYIKGINWNYLGNEKEADEAKDAFNMKVE
ncbi:MAG: pitrilysin family protein [Bacteroidota bacterium]|nr:pitrilysin family protein [Bacteroidota bacterium]